MKITLLLSAVIMLCSCVSIPTYRTRYVCEQNQDVRDKLADATARCIQSTAISGGSTHMQRFITQCRKNAMSIYCKRAPYFKRWSFPYGSSVELPCSKAQSAAEYYVCQYGE